MHSDLTLSDLTALSGLDVLDHLDREVTVPVTDGLQAQGDLIVIPYALVGAAVERTPWARSIRVPLSGVELLRSSAGGNPHSLVADEGTCRWTTPSGTPWVSPWASSRRPGPRISSIPSTGRRGSLRVAT